LSRAEIAEVEGPYETYAGSPASKGILQPDMWGVVPSTRFDWAALRARVARFGLRNSLLVAPMPTASTAQILGNNESIEPFTSNMYSRRVLAGDFPMVNRHLMRDLIELDIWSPSVRNHIIADQGSVQKIPCIPTSIKDLYKTVRSHRLMQEAARSIRPAPYARCRSGRSSSAPSSTCRLTVARSSASRSRSTSSLQRPTARR
jgi:ribonucleotide reductase alpha subunit